MGIIKTIKKKYRGLVFITRWYGYRAINLIQKWIDIFSREEKPSSEMLVEICAIVKDENDYLPEWIDHHLKLGFDRIVIYDNNSKKKFPGSEKVIVKNWPEKNSQMKCYLKHATTTEADWTAYIDVDEFIFLNQDKNVKDFINRFTALGRNGKEIRALYLYWLMYGANGHFAKPKGGVVDNFTKPCRSAAPHTKIIAKSKYIRMFIHPHDANIIGDKLDVPLEVAQINHYFTKSLEEWREKINRGRADEKRKRDFNEFYLYNDDMKADDK